MPSKKGPGVKVTAGEKRRFDQLRAAGWSIEASAEAIGRSTSWGYNYEHDKHAGPRNTTHPKQPMRTDDVLPVSTYEDAVELVIAISDDDEKAFDLFDKYGAGVVPLMAEVARFLAHCRAIDLQNQLLDIHEGTEWEQEIRDKPITRDDILHSVPAAIARHRKGEGYIQLQPPRAYVWERQLMEEHPEFAELADLAHAAMQSDDPEAAMRDLRRRVRDGEFLDDEEPDLETVSSNGHH